MEWSSGIPMSMGRHLTYVRCRVLFRLFDFRLGHVSMGSPPGDSMTTESIIKKAEYLENKRHLRGHRITVVCRPRTVDHSKQKNRSINSGLSLLPNPLLSITPSRYSSFITLLFDSRQWPFYNPSGCL
jgi:hypothetical protein